MAKSQLRANQGRIFDNFLMLSEKRDVLHPDIMGTRVERSFKPEDSKAVYSKVTASDAVDAPLHRHLNLPKFSFSTTMRNGRPMSQFG